jgi:hypothetical protein
MNDVEKFLEEVRLEKEKYNFVRASGDCVCEICGKKYYQHKFTEHRDWNDDPFLNKLCDGRIVKL